MDPLVAVELNHRINAVRVSIGELKIERKFIRYGKLF